MSVYLRMLERWDVSRIAFTSMNGEHQSYADLHKKVLDTVGGSISLQSTPGEGSAFIVSWPKHMDK